jgi:hypothetical protein
LSVTPTASPYTLDVTLGYEAALRLAVIGPIATHRTELAPSPI